MKIGQVKFRSTFYVEIINNNNDRGYEFTVNASSKEEAKKMAEKMFSAQHPNIKLGECAHVII